MLCQNCNQREATTHIHQTINGQTAEYNLCEECAATIGCKNIFSTIGLNDLLSNFFGEGGSSLQQGTVERCPKCGMSFEEIVKTGRTGCAKCYETFYDRLLPSLQRIHGKAQHVGKIASTASPEAKRQSVMEKLKLEMQAAIEVQDFEKAANLRDQINAMEKGEN